MCFCDIAFVLIRPCIHCVTTTAPLLSRLIQQILLLISPVLQGLRYWCTRVGNKTENLKYSLSSSVLTATQTLLPAYFYSSSIYVLNLDAWVNLFGYAFLIIELSLNIGSCLLFADIRTELSFLGLGLAPAIGLLAVSLVMLVSN
ncbi:unnamed protein product [Amoebophrya sp. A120]|nr:unnamed protein product [Amoebophrya sp. A120]|eukprot:GSA120T00018469001.1